MACHNAGFIDKQDQVRAGASSFADAFTKDEMALITSLYKDATTLGAAIKSDSLRFHGPLAELEIDPTADDPVSTTARRYMEPMTVGEAAAYLGLSSSEFVETVKTSDLAGRLLAGHVAADALDPDHAPTTSFWGVGRFGLPSPGGPPRSHSTIPEACTLLPSSVTWPSSSASPP